MENTQSTEKLLESVTDQNGLINLKKLARVIMEKRTELITESQFEAELKNEAEKLYLELSASRPHPEYRTILNLIGSMDLSPIVRKFKLVFSAIVSDPIPILEVRHE